MDWAKEYYTAQSETFATGNITDNHRAIAQQLQAWCTNINPCNSILELGAGMGGVAASLADLGFDVTAIEFNSSDAQHARTLASAVTTGSLNVVEEDFYITSLGRRFDFIFYWDGFGIGNNTDQQDLLKRIGTEWLEPHGRAAIDIFSPWNWKARAGEISSFTTPDGKQWERRVEFDARHQRIIDHWEPIPDRSEHRSQNIRCYTIPEFDELLIDTGLRAEAYVSMSGRIVTPDEGGASPSDELATTNGYVALLARENS